MILDYPCGTQIITGLLVRGKLRVRVREGGEAVETTSSSQK